MKQEGEKFDFNAMGKEEKGQVCSNSSDKINYEKNVKALIG